MVISYVLIFINFILTIMTEKKLSTINRLITIKKQIFYIFAKLAINIKL